MNGLEALVRALERLPDLVKQLERSIDRLERLPSARPADADPLLKVPDAARLLGVQPSTLADWRYRGTGPDHVKQGRFVRYLYSDVVKYRERLRVTTADSRLIDQEREESDRAEE